ncbi:MAG: hypothetical protein E7643_05380 [Ruminococcaceae bacterium]|nr:hypothetical protein [Oscillospiraceae bacterium]
MLAIKILGALLILSVGGIASFASVRYEKKALLVLDGWIDLIRHIRTQIDCYLTPLDEILDGCLHHAKDLPSLYRCTSVYLDGNERHLIEGFTRDVGAGYREEQLRLCDFCIEELRCRRASRATQLPMRTRLAVTLSVCIALGTAILLW